MVLLGVAGGDHHHGGVTQPYRHGAELAQQSKHSPGSLNSWTLFRWLDADRLVGVLNDDLVAFLRQVFYDENLVDEQLPLAPILQHIGAIDETGVEEAVATLGRLLDEGH